MKVDLRQLCWKYPWRLSCHIKGVFTEVYRTALVKRVKAETHLLDRSFLLVLMSLGPAFFSVLEFFLMGNKKIIDFPHILIRPY